MGRGEPLNVGKTRGGWILICVEKQKIGDGEVVQPVRDCGMLANAIESIAEYEGLAHTSVEERLDSQMIASTEEALPGAVPNGEGKIAEQAVDTALAPGLVGTQDEFDIGRIRREIFVALGSQSRDQIAARIDTGIGDDPYFAIEGAGLAFMLGFFGCFQQRMAETDVAFQL